MLRVKMGYFLLRCDTTYCCGVCCYIMLDILIFLFACMDICITHLSPSPRLEWGAGAGC